MDESISKDGRGNMIQFVRFLYGTKEAFLDETLQKNIRRTFTKEHAKFNREEIVYFTLGTENTALLTKLGANHIVQISKDHSFETGNSYHSYNKLILMSEAMQQFGQMLYLDFDVYYEENFDPVSIRHTLLSEANGIGKMVQIPSVSYLNKRFPWRGWNGLEGREKISPRKGVICCFIFLQQNGLVFQDIFDTHEELKDKYPNRPIGDEQTIMYSLEKKFGPLPVSRMEKELEPSVIKIKKSSLNKLGYPAKNSMLFHR